MFVGYYYVLRGHLLTQQRDSTATAAAAAGKVTLLFSDSPQLEVLRRCVNKKSAAASAILKTFSLGVCKMLNKKVLFVLAAGILFELQRDHGGVSCFEEGTHVAETVLVEVEEVPSKHVIPEPEKAKSGTYLSILKGLVEVERAHLKELQVILKNPNSPVKVILEELQNKSAAQTAAVLATAASS